MRSLEVIPCPPLRPYVRLIWLLEVDTPAGAGPVERVTPDGLVELVFHYRNPVSCRYEGEPFEPQARSTAVSQTRSYLEFRTEQATGLISVRFQPWGAYHFFHPPLAEFADRQIACESLWGRDVFEVEEQLAEAQGDEARITIVQSFLLAQFRRHQKRDIEPLVRAVWHRRGKISMPDLARDLGIGERTMQRLFARGLGTSPKGFARLSRFLHACSLLRKCPGMSLTETGLTCGYYDQPHFITEFKAYAGLTPGQFREKGNVSFLETG